MRRNVFFCLVYLFVSVGVGTALKLPDIKYKRQLFRENLLPQFGGKIPEAAFNRERLALNIYNKNGLYVSDQNYVEQRPHIYNNKHFFYNTIKVNLPSRNIDTSYLYREPVKYDLLPNLIFHKFPSSPILSLNVLRNRSKKMSGYTWNSINPDEILKEMKPKLHALLHYND